MGAASAIGMGRFALEKAVAYAKDRTVWKTPIGAHQAIAHPLAAGKVELEMAKLMMQKAATLYDAGDDWGPLNRPTWPSTPRRKRRRSSSTRPCTPSVATV